MEHTGWDEVGGQGSFEFVPTKLVATTQMKTASDGWFADFSETGVPQIATGRLPVRTATEASAVVAKLVGYDQQAPGTSSSRALLVTDENIGTDFSAETQQIGILLPSSLEKTVINFASADAGTIRAQLLSQLNAGQLFVNYIGHGSVDVWAGSGILTGDDAMNLNNRGLLPLVVTMDCLNGFFHDVYQTSMAESLLLAPNGGAAAVWADVAAHVLDDAENRAVELAKHDDRFLGDAQRHVLGRRDNGRSRERDLLA